MFSRILLGSLLIAAVAAACGGGSGGADGPPSGGDGTPVGTDAFHPGSALPQLMANPAADVAIATRQDGTTGEIYDTSITAAFRASPMPTPYTVAEQLGTCARVVSDVPFCDPACTGDEVCTASNTCTTAAPLQSAGTLTVGAQTLEPTAGFYTFDSPGGVFAATDTITVSAAGDAFAAFSADLAVPDPLTAVVQPGALRAGEDATFTWAPADDTGTFVGVRLIADRGHNPVHPSIIYCAVDDAAGTLTVPSSLIDPHIDPSNWSCGDCFTSQLIRFRTTTTASGVRVWYGQSVDVYGIPDRS